MEAFFYAVRSAVAAMLFPQVPDGPETAVIYVHIFAIKVSGMSQAVVYIKNVRYSKTLLSINTLCYYSYGLKRKLSRMVCLLYVFVKVARRWLVDGWF